MDIDPDKWITGRVVGQKRWADNLYSLRVDADLPPFMPGQFNKLALPMVTEKGEEMVARAYSYVNAPDERPHEFYYIGVPDGPLTTRLQQLAPGDTIYLANGAHGFLTLAEAAQKKHLWMLSTGTALGPFLSILKSGAAWERYERIVLVHAVRSAAELTYGDTLRALLAAHPRLSFVPFVSREPHAEALAGRVPLAIADGRLEARAGIAMAPEDSAVMICGNPAMVKDTEKALLARGLKRHRRHAHGNFIVENYW